MAAAQQIVQNLADVLCQKHKPWKPRDTQIGLSSEREKCLKILRFFGYQVFLSCICRHVTDKYIVVIIPM
jgi:hypothetical protein